MMWSKIMILVMLGVGIAWVNLNYIQPYSMIGEGLDYCRALEEEGYFENEYDVADHKNCTVGYEKGKNKEKKWYCSFSGCFSIDSYDDECEENIDMKDYGMRCTHFSLGYFATAGTIMLWGFVATMIFLIFFVLWEGEEDETN